MNILCLDVVFGAVLSAMYFAIVLSVELSVIYWIVLALSVWIVYTADHLVDAYRLKQSAHTKRHLYIYNHFRTFSLLVLIFTMANLLIVIYLLDKTVLQFGLFIGFIAGCYLFVLLLIKGKKVRLLTKELFVACIYMLGICGVPIGMTGFHLEAHQWLIFTGFSLLVLSDILLLSFYEMEADQLDGHYTLAVHKGKLPVKKMIIVLVSVVILLSGILMIVAKGAVTQYASGILVLMAISILFLLIFESYFRKNNTYRYLSEMVFWLPGVLLLV